MVDASDIQENAEQFSGHTLDDMAEEGVRTTSEENDREGHESLDKGKRRVWVYGALGVLCLLVGGGFLYRERAKPVTGSHQIQREPSIANEASTGDHVLAFDPFVIPLKSSGQYTYLLLSISFKLPNRQLKREISGVKEQIRGILYDALKEEINKKGDIPSLQELKEFLADGLSTVLYKEKGDGIYITKFLAL
jgi:flagellar basal body-associated protein FliL